MCELEEDLAAMLVHGICYLFPSSNLFRCIDAGRVWVALALLAHRCTFCDDQSCGGSLCVVQRIQFCGRIARTRAHTREWGHHDAVRYGNASELQRLEKQWRVQRNCPVYCYCCCGTDPLNCQRTVISPMSILTSRGSETS